MNRNLFAAIALAFAAACGGAVSDADSSADDLAAPASAEPMQWLALAQKTASAKYAPNAQLMHVDGSASGSGYAWKFTFRGDLGAWATVATDGKTAKVTEHHTMIEPPIGMQVIDTSKVAITMASLRTICQVHSMRSGIKTISLDEPLTQTAHPLWSVATASADLLVDAVSGAVVPQ